VTPRFGEVWLAPNATVLPGGMLCLIVSHDAYNSATGRYVVVEVVTDPELTGGAMICDLGPAGMALTGVPITVGPSWFAGPDTPVVEVDLDVARVAANQVKSIIGP
jgi:hypothetical protein